MSGLTAGLMIGGTALSAGGSLFNSSQSAARVNAMMEARARAIRDLIFRNDKLADEAQPIFNTQLGSMTAENQAAERDKLAANRVATGQAPSTSPTIVGGASNPVNGEIGRQAKLVSDRVAQVGKAKAAVNAYGDVQNRAGIGMSETGQRLGTLSNFAKGNLGVFNADIQSADNNAAKDFQSPIGDIMKGVGSMAALGGSFMGAPGTTVAPEGGFANVGDLMKARNIGQPSFFDKIGGFFRAGA